MPPLSRAGIWLCYDARRIYMQTAVFTAQFTLIWRGWFTHLRGLSRLWLPCPSALAYNAAAGSPMIDFSFTVVIINSVVEISGLTYQVKSIQYIFMLHIAFFKKSNYSGLQVLQCRTSCLLQKGILYHWAIEWLIPVYITVEYGESQDNSLSHLKTRGLQWHDSANLVSSSRFKNSGSLEGR